MSAAFSRALSRIGPARIGSVRARVLSLIALAAVPIIVVAVLIAFQNSRFISDRALQGARLMRNADVARYRSALHGTEQTLIALSRVQMFQRAGQAPGAGDCGALLGSIVALAPHHYADLFVLAPDGQVRCGARTRAADGKARAAEASLAEAPWFRRVLAAKSFTLGSLEPAGDPAGSGGVMVAATPILENDVVTGVVAAVLPAGGILSPGPYGAGDAAGVLWLFDGAGRLVTGASQGGAIQADADRTEADQPPPALLARLLSADQADAQASSRGGTPFAYAAARLSPGLGLLVGYRAVAEADKGRDMLIVRLAELGVLLAAGLVGVAAGVDLGVVRPIKALTRAVRRWQDGAGFDPGADRGAPREVRSLSAAFARATASLTERELQLRAALTQQELLMQEIHHRVKNNLQIVASLLNLQASRIRQPQARAEFQSARDRVRALATLHRHLYVQGELHTINMRSFLEELCGQLFQAMGEREGGRIGLEIDAPELQMSSDQAVPLALIVTEAVSNALKYAFPGGRAGHVRVRLTVEGEFADLLIEDDGVGIPAGRVETETGTRDGLGLQLIRGFARQLGASLEVREGDAGGGVDGGGGTRYLIRLKLRRDDRDPDPVLHEEPAEPDGAPAVAGGADAADG